MEDSPNPFKPGAGRVPPELAGRDELMRTVNRALQSTVAQSEGERSFILSGLRGVGKTVLLNEFVRRSNESKRWIAIKVEANAHQSLGEVLLRELHLALRRTMSLGDRARAGLSQALRAFRSFQVSIDPTGSYSFGFDVQPEPGLADSGNFGQDARDLLVELGLGARELGMGVLIAIDELQDATKADLSGLNLALHALGQDPWPVPVVMIGTGLPSLPAVLADATSYAERLYDYRALDLLDDEQTRAALTRPAERFDVVWDDEALDAAVVAIGGYPYFAQACGKYIWDARETAGRITLDDVAVGTASARDEIDRGLYQSRWDRATPRQRDFLRAMTADDGRPSAIQDLVARTGRRRASDLSVVRDELIKTGQIYSSDRGYVAFTVPGMADFIERKVPA